MHEIGISFDNIIFLMNLKHEDYKQNIVSYIVKRIDNDTATKISNNVNIIYHNFSIIGIIDDDLCKVNLMLTITK